MNFVGQLNESGFSGLLRNSRTAIETRFHEVLSVLQQGDVKFILVGGLAGMAMGSARATVDVEIVYRRSETDIVRLAKCLAPYEPYLRGAPPGLPFQFNEETIRQGLNLTLTTRIGDLDLLGEITGGGSYEQLLQFTEPIQIFGLDIQCVTLEKLIDLKRAAGRPRDLEAIAELEALMEESEGR